MRAMLFTLVFLCGCNYYEMTRLVGLEGDPDSSETTELNFSRVQSAVLTPCCVRCHSGPGAQMGVDVTDHAALVRDGWVVPGDPAKSELYQVVVSEYMPPNAPFPTQDQMKVLHRWIEQGAKK